MKCSLLSLIFLKRCLVFPILLFSSISLHWSLKKAFLSLLAILWNSAFRCLYLSFSPLLFASLLFTAICKASPDSHFAFFHFFSMGMVLIPVSCTMSQTSFHSSSGTLSDQIPYEYTVEVRNRFKGQDLIECLMKYGWRFVTLYRRQDLSPSRPPPWKRNEKKQNGCLGRPYK